MDAVTLLRRKAKRVRLNVLKDAKAAGINLSGAAEAAFRAELARCGYEDNKAAIDAFNEDAEKNGLWSDGTRMF